MTLHRNDIDGIVITAVTGASGFLGNVLVRELLSRGRSVRAVVNTSQQGLEGLDVEIVKADVRDIDELRPAFAGVTSVFHLAAIISLGGDLRRRVTEVNVIGAQNAARAALETGVSRYVHFSSVHAFDLSPTAEVIDEKATRAGGTHPHYDHTKTLGEMAVREVIKEGLHGVIVHPSGVIGPGDHRPSRVGQVLLDLAVRKLPILLPGGFNWVDVRDVCEGAIAAEHCGRIGESYLLTGYWHSARQIASFGTEITGVAPPRFDIPLWIARGIAPVGTLYGWLTKTEPRLNSNVLAALCAAHNISHAKAAQELGYVPRSIRESVHDSYRWFEAAGMLASPLPSLGET